MSTEGKLVAWGVSGFVLLIVLGLLFSFTVVNVGHRGVVTSFGRVKETTLTEGFQFVSPFDSVHEIDVRTTKVEVDVAAASKDLQSVTAKIALNFHVNPDFVKPLYQETAGRFEDTLLAPAIQESVKASTAQFTAEELVTKRQEVKDRIVASLKSQDKLRFFFIDDVSIIDFDYSESFNASIERKVTAEQDALAAKNKLEQTKYEAEQKVVTAKAEAESLSIQAAALANNASLVELEAVRKWNGVLPSNTGGVIPFLNIK